MLPWVMANEGVTIDAVRDRFGYAKDSDVMKDLEVVFLCGLPGYGPGELMDAYVLGDEVVVDDADYFARPLRLNAAEALVLLSAGSAVMESSAAPPALASAVRKLQAVVSPSDGALAVDLGDEPEYVDALRRAASDGAVVRIDYTSVGSGLDTTRDIEPWTVFSSLGHWYVRAHCRLADAERLFRLDRIRSAVPTGDAFQPPTDMDVPEHLYSPSADDVHATIELRPAAAWVTEYYPVEILEQDDDRIVIDFATTAPEVAARLMLRLGDDARLVAGDEVAATLSDLRRRILARYE
jgi:proteasome accessory factor C